MYERCLKFKQNAKKKKENLLKEKEDKIKRDEDKILKEINSHKLEKSKINEKIKCSTRHSISRFDQEFPPINTRSRFPPLARWL